MFSFLQVNDEAGLPAIPEFVTKYSILKVLSYDFRAGFNSSIKLK